MNRRSNLSRQVIVTAICSSFLTTRHGGYIFNFNHNDVDYRLLDYLTLRISPGCTI
jgi:hypothetical protein